MVKHQHDRARLDQYHERRDFTRSTEPTGDAGSTSGNPVFVIQKHDASNLHYDVRLEVDGVLKSWAVPKGPSTDPREKRLAIATEDHPLEYADFEGVIPEGEYGAGTVLVWDYGTYENITEKENGLRPMSEALAKGHALVRLSGEKIHGGYTLQRIDDDADQWLLIKMDDEAADARRNPVSTEPDSVVSGRDLDGIAAGGGGMSSSRDIAALVADLPDRAHPEWIAPMLALLTDARFSDPNWIFERKLDGVRLLVFRDGDRIRLMTRNRNEVSDTYPELIEALAQQPASDFVADGEVVAFDGDLTSFSSLQGRMQITDPDKARASGIVVYLYLFDLLHLVGHDLTDLPLRRRKSLLRRALCFDDPLRFTPHRNEDGEAFFERACARGWEGLIAKDATAPYTHGRSRDWLKFKCSRGQELVIGGFTEPKGDRVGFGALLLGYFEDGRLRYAGKVGTGFDDAFLEQFHQTLQARRRETPPFADAVDEDATWVRPDLVAEIGFTEWTGAGRLRHPRFLGLRRDKAAEDVTREVPDA